MVINPTQSQEMLERIDRLHVLGHDDWWQLACRIAADRSKRRWDYVRGIIDRCLVEGHAPGVPRNGQGPPDARERVPSALAGMHLVMQDIGMEAVNGSATAT
jgi:hypothetical protein